LTVNSGADYPRRSWEEAVFARSRGSFFRNSANPAHFGPFHRVFVPAVRRRKGARGGLFKRYKNCLLLSIASISVRAGASRAEESLP